MSEKSSEQYKPLTRGTVVAKRYEVEKYLGESLLGPTYVVKNRDTQKLIALKFVRPEYKAASELDDVKALLKKARKIKHPNVVQYGNAGEDKGMIFFTQEYFPSVNLRQLMIDYKADAKEFSVNEAFQLVSKILEALQVIHAQGLFHTNLKPENILIMVAGGSGLYSMVMPSWGGAAHFNSPVSVKIEMDQFCEVPGLAGASA